MAQGVTIDFNANLARFTSAIDKATNDLTKFQTNAERIGKNIGNALSSLTVAIPTAAIAAYSKSLIDLADNVNDLSQKTGISVKNLAAWQAASESSGTSLESIGKGIKALAPNIVKFGEEFKALGFDISDPNKLLEQLADVVSSVEDPMKRSALATALMKKSGDELIPLLMMGSKGIAEMREKSSAYADELAKLAPKADEFNDALKLLELRVKANSLGFLQTQMEGLTGIAALLTDLISGPRGFAKAIDGVADAVPKWLAPLKLLVSGFAAAANQIAPFAEKVLALTTTTQGGSRSSGGLIGGPVPDAVAKSTESPKANALLKLLGDGSKKGSAKATKPFELFGDSFERDLAKGEKIIDGFESNLAERVTAINDSIAEIGMSDDQRERFKALADIDKQFRASEQNIKEAFRGNPEAVDKATAALARLRDEAKGQTVAALDELKRKNDEVNSSFEEGSKRALQSYAKEATNVAQNAERVMTNAFRNMEDALVDFVQKGKLDFRSLADSIISDMVRMSIRQGITGPLASMGGSFIGDALGSVLIPSFSFAGGIDQVPYDMTARIHKGERVVPAHENIPQNFSNSMQSPDPISLSFNIDARGAELGVEHRIEAGVKRAVDLAVRAVGAKADRGGSYAKTLGRRA